MSQEVTEKIVTITKEELTSLPVATFTGKITLVDSEETAKKAIDTLRKEKIIGFDTETKPSFKRGQTNNVALLQLSSDTESYLFRLNHIGLPECVKNLLEDDNLLKIGLSIHDDFHNLHRLYQLEPQAFIDLQNYVKQFRIIDNSLAKIYAILFDERISKGQRLTNWEADTLTVNQQAYAALDAIACVRIYNYLSENKFNPLTSKYLHDAPEKED